MKIMYIDDEKVCRVLFQKLVQKRLANADVKCFTHSYSVFTDSKVFNPDVIVSDYEFPGSTLSDQKVVVDFLKSFDGKVIIYTMHDTAYIEKINPIPNALVVNKREDIIEVLRTLIPEANPTGV